MAEHNEELRRSFQDVASQHTRTMRTAFPVRLVEYLGMVPRWDGQGETRGIYRGRCIVEPLEQQMRHPSGQTINLPTEMYAYVNWYKSGDVLIRLPLYRGQVFWVTVSDRALDYLLQSKRPQHWELSREHYEDDLMLIPFGVQTEEDPDTPHEALDCLYIATVNADGSPQQKFMMIPEGENRTAEVKFVTPKFTVISPSIDMVNYGGPNTSRIGDHDNDSESNGPDALAEGSPAMRVASSSGPWEGVTEDEFMSLSAPPDPAAEQIYEGGKKLNGDSGAPQFLYDDEGNLIRPLRTLADQIWAGSGLETTTDAVLDALEGTQKIVEEGDNPWIKIKDFVVDLLSGGE